MCRSFSLRACVCACGCRAGRERAGGRDDAAWWGRTQNGRNERAQGQQQQAQEKQRLAKLQHTGARLSQELGVRVEKREDRERLGRGNKAVQDQKRVHLSRTDTHWTTVVKGENAEESVCIPRQMKRSGSGGRNSAGAAGPGGKSATTRGGETDCRRDRDRGERASSGRRNQSCRE